MAIVTTDNKVTYTITSGVTDYAFNFPIIKDEDLTVVVYDTNNNSTTLTLNTDYSVTGAGDENGGHITLLSSQTAGYTLLIYREVEETQETRYTEGDPFPAEEHEKALDKLTMITQQLSEKVSRSMKYNVIDQQSSTELPILEANKIFITDDNKNIAMTDNILPQINLHITNTNNPHNTKLSNLNDTTITAPSENQVLAYKNGSWKNMNATNIPTPTVLQLTRSGFNRDNPDSMGDISFDSATREFTIQPKAGASDFSYYINGYIHTQTTAITVTIPNTTDRYYIYFDGDVLKYITVNDAYNISNFFGSYALVGAVYWNATEGIGIYSDERHGVDISAIEHEYEHFTFGARYGGGLDLVGISDGTSTYSKITSGSIWDEDIHHTIDESTEHSFMYRIGSDGRWIITDASNAVAFKENTATYYQYNRYNDTTGEWELVEGQSDSDFWIIFYVAIPTLNKGSIFKIIGQNAYENKAQARAHISTELSRLTLDGLIGEEYVFLYATIVKRTGVLKAIDTYGSLYYDLRGLNKSTSTGESGALTAVVEDPTPELGGELDAGLNTVYFDLQEITASNGNATVDWNRSNYAKITLTGDVTLSFTNPTGACTLNLHIFQDNAGGHTLTLPNNIVWVDNDVPSLSTAANAKATIILQWDGLEYLASYVEYQ